MSIAGKVGRIVRGRRVELDLTQSAVSSAVGTSRSYYAAIEAGRANPSVGFVDRLAEVLGLRLDLVAAPITIVLGPNVRDAVHARCSAYVARRLLAAGWIVLREVELVDGRLHGWIDLLAFDPRTGTLLIIEIKTSIEDIGRLERQIGWYARVVLSAVPAEWKPRLIASWVLGLASAEIDHVIAQHGDLIDQTFPIRASSMRDIVSGAIAELHGDGLALIDPRSRRRDWLIATRADGRRTPAPYQDRAGAARVLGI
ncbi:MAG TPA: helix-turn-helix domain-containing protein [Candidatus Limnocylindrales bacterium]|nr:helix-turn-helix domain-containing protein [Candidatus Limnocylindrales bacterium]